MTGTDGPVLARCMLGLAPCGTAGVIHLPGGFEKCGVGGGAGCDAAESTIIKRATLGLPPAIRNVCPAFTGRFP